VPRHAFTNRTPISGLILRRHQKLRGASRNLQKKPITPIGKEGIIRCSMSNLLLMSCGFIYAQRLEPTGHSLTAQDIFADAPQECGFGIEVLDDGTGEDGDSAEMPVKEPVVSAGLQQVMLRGSLLARKPAQSKFGENI
jgi:hypothetical protein